MRLQSFYYWVIENGKYYNIMIGKSIKLKKLYVKNNNKNMCYAMQQLLDQVLTFSISSSLVIFLAKVE